MNLDGIWVRKECKGLTLASWTQKVIVFSHCSHDDIVGLFGLERIPTEGL
jgi:hypothetical protein